MSFLRAFALFEALTYSINRSGKGVSRRSGRSQHSEEGTGSSLITTALVLRPPKACPLRKQRSDRAYTNKSKSTQNHPDMSHDEVPIQSQSQLGDTMVHINPVTQVNQSGLFSVFSLQQVDAPSTSLDGQTGGQNVRIAYITLKILH